MVSLAPILVYLLPQIIAEEKNKALSSRTGILQAAQELMVVISERANFLRLVMIGDVAEHVLDVLKYLEAETVDYDQVKLKSSITNKSQIKISCRYIKHRRIALCMASGKTWNAASKALKME